MSVKKDYQHKLEMELELEEWDDRIKQLGTLSDKANPDDKVE